MTATDDRFPDIPLRDFIASREGISHTPVERGKRLHDEWHAVIRSDYAALEKLADDDAKRATLAEMWPRYIEGYRKRQVSLLAAESRVVSTMIAGPSNFPVRQMEKRNQTADRRRTEAIEWRDRGIERIAKALTPGSHPIMSGDNDAVERLEARLAKEKQEHELCKRVNAAVRKVLKFAEEDRAEKLASLAGFSIESAKLYLTPDCFGCIGVPSYVMTNRSANIRRMAKRLESLKRAKACTPSRIAGPDGITVEDDPAANRVRIEFPGKPADEIRGELKKRGFRWTPSLGVWQAYRNARTVCYASELLGRS